MSVQKKAALLMVILYLVFLCLLCGPIRWEYAHTYQHWIEGVGTDLPQPTLAVGLPFLGLGVDGALSGIGLILGWCVIWGGPLVLLTCLWRTQSHEVLRDLLLFGGGCYFMLMLGLCSVIAFSLWLPFGFL